MRVNKSDSQLLDRITDGRALLSVVVCNASTESIFTNPVIRSPREVIEIMNRARAGIDNRLETNKR